MYAHKPSRLVAGTGKELKGEVASEYLRMMTPNVRWGIISTARINRRVAPGITASPLTQLVGIASRSPARAEQAAQAFGAKQAFGSYAALLASEEIDAVYISLPNALHADWIIRAAEAGKHVLCEKPLTATVREAEDAVRACEKAGVLLMEAFMYRHHPQHTVVTDSITQGRIGDVTLMTTQFSFYLPPSDDIRWQGALAGGALMDIGCYCINVARYLFHADPVAARAIWTRDDTHDVDSATLALLTFPGHRSASFACSMLLPRVQRYDVMGTEGTITAPSAFVPSDAPRVHVRTREGDEERIIPQVDQYQRQLEHFSQCILEDTPLTYPAENGLANMRAIAMVQQAAHTP
jgi:xylose dehydrogenase (NAD/NADP)